MILFFRSKANIVYAIGMEQPFQNSEIQQLKWLLGDAEPLADQQLTGYFIGPRKEMITPWSTNAVEITQTMGIKGISRIEEFTAAENDAVAYDPMLQMRYDNLDQEIFTI